MTASGGGHTEKIHAPHPCQGSMTVFRKMTRFEEGTRSTKAASPNTGFASVTFCVPPRVAT